MKKVVLKLDQFSKAELEAKRKNALRGGIGCACVCVGCPCVGDWISQMNTDDGKGNEIDSAKTTYDKYGLY